MSALEYGRNSRQYSNLLRGTTGQCKKTNEPEAWGFGLVWRLTFTQNDRQMPRTYFFLSFFGFLTSLRCELLPLPMFKLLVQIPRRGIVTRRSLPRYFYSRAK